MIFSLMSIMISLFVQAMIWSVRLTMVVLKLLFDLFEAMVAEARH